MPPGVAGRLTRTQALTLLCDPKLLAKTYRGKADEVAAYAARRRKQNEEMTQRLTDALVKALSDG